VRRQLFWLVVIGAAVAVAVAHRVRTRVRAQIRPAPETAPGFPDAGSEQTPRDREPAGDRWFAEGAPTGAPAMVATMEATSAAPVVTRHDETRHDENGSPTVVTRPVTVSAPPEAAFAPVALPPRRRLSGASLAGLAAVAGVGAIALGAWGVASSLSDDSNGTGQSAVAIEGVQQVVSLLSKPATTSIPIQGSGRRIILVVGAKGYGVLVLNGLGRPPVGKTYQAWVIKPNVKAPASAGVFSGEEAVVPLTTPVPPGGVVAITIEPAGGSPAPTQTPKLVATRT
jgi:hypothetical protein